MTRWLGVGSLAALAVAVYALRLDFSAGLFVDDAWYLVLAKALWQGDGFRLISSATTPILPAFPPGFPLLLAPVFGIAPDFPANVVGFKAISIAAMFGACAATYFYLVRFRSAPPAVAVAVAAIVALMPAFVFLATSTVMAEAVFTCAQLCLVLSIERAARVPGAHLTRSAAISGLVGGATLLIRLAGVATVAAAALYLWQQRGRRAAFIFGAVVVLCYAPWAVYAGMSRQSEIDQSQHGGSVSYTYPQLLLMNYGGDARSGQTSLRDLPGRVAANLLNIAGRDVGAFVLPAVYRTPFESGQEVFGMNGERGIRATSMGGATASVWLSLAISAFALIGFVTAARRGLTMAEFLVPLTLAMIVLVPALTFRYVLPLAPFIVFYFFCGLERVRALMLRSAAWQFGAPFRTAAACILVLFAAEHARYVWSAHYGPRPLWLQEYADVRAVTDWIGANLQADAHVASNNPGLVYLATGHLGVSMGDARNRWQDWQASGIQYGAAVQPAQMPAADLPYDVLFTSSNRLRWVIAFKAGVDRK